MEKIILLDIDILTDSELLKNDVRIDHNKVLLLNDFCDAHDINVSIITKWYGILTPTGIRSIMFMLGFNNFRLKLSHPLGYDIDEGDEFYLEEHIQKDYSNKKYVALVSDKNINYISKEENKVDNVIVVDTETGFTKEYFWMIEKLLE